MIKILDVFCGAGGAAVGYAQALTEMGMPFRIVGVDKNPQPFYPFEFVRGDGAIALYKYGRCFDFIHASPPCQAFSVATAGYRDRIMYPNYIPSTRHFIQASGRPGIIENVMPAPICSDLILRGDLFGLKVLRKRKFEQVNCFHLWPSPPGRYKGSVYDGDFISVFGQNGSYRNNSSLPSGWRPKFDQGSIMATWQYAMGMPWVHDYGGLAEAIPPAYTRYIGLQLFSTLWK